MLRAGNLKNYKEYGEAMLVNCDIRNLPFKVNSFDAILQTILFSGLCGVNFIVELGKKGGVWG